jgi:hypothetical protein
MSVWTDLRDAIRTAILLQDRVQRLITFAASRQLSPDRSSFLPAKQG